MQSSPRNQFNARRWQRLQELFERALPLDPEARSRLLLDECAEDVALREHCSGKKVRLPLKAQTEDK